MNKTKKQIILLIIIVLIGVGYAVNQYIIAPEKLLIQEKAKQVEADKQKLSLLKIQSTEAIKLKAEVAKLKLVAETIGDVTVADIDTPQLIFDFYTSCKKYGIKGENLVFQLADTNTKIDKATEGATVNPNSASTQQSAGNNQAIVSPTPTTPSSSAEVIDKTKATSDLIKLTIDLKVSGDKNKMEKYLKSLNTLTIRKINVKNIKLEATVAQDTNTQGAASTPDITSTNVTIVSNQVTADITFNQYIYSNNKDIIRSSTYSFYDGKTGFSNFSDMFK